MWITYLIAIILFLINVYIIKHIEGIEVSRFGVIIFSLFILIPYFNVALMTIMLVIFITSLCIKETTWKGNNKLIEWLNKPI